MRGSEYNTQVLARHKSRVLVSATPGLATRATIDNSEAKQVTRRRSNQFSTTSLCFVQARSEALASLADFVDENASRTSGPLELITGFFRLRDGRVYLTVKAMNAVWEHANAKGSNLLVLLALADYAHDDGTLAYPSIKTLCDKTRLSERAVQYCLRKLVEEGEIVLRKAATQYVPNVYDLRGAMFAPDSGVQTDALRGASSCTRSERDPSTTPQTSKKQKSDGGSRARRKPRKDETTIPDEFRVFNDKLKEIAEPYRLKGVDVELEHGNFVDSADDKDTLHKNWLGAWHTWLRNALRWGRRDKTLVPPADAQQAPKWRTVRDRMREKETQ